MSLEDPNLSKTTAFKNPLSEDILSTVRSLLQQDKLQDRLKKAGGGEPCLSFRSYLKPLLEKEFGSPAQFLAALQGLKDGAQAFTVIRDDLLSTYAAQLKLAEDEASSLVAPATGLPDSGWVR